MLESPAQDSYQSRARLTGGTSGDAIYRAVINELKSRNCHGTIYDIGCGTAAIASLIDAAMPDLFNSYVGVDIVRYDSFPASHSFVAASLDKTPWPIADAVADVAMAIETVEHLENARALVREMSRITKPGGMILITTPNQLSWASLLYLLLRNQFLAFQKSPGLYPAHITALLPIDLIRICEECGLQNVVVRYTNEGRVPLSAKRWPNFLRGKRFSDNVIVSAMKSAPQDV